MLADATANPDWIAADLLAQAEHDDAAQSILITDDAGLADAVEAAVERQLTHPAARRRSPARELARLRRDHRGRRRWTDAVPLVDRIAPEHLEIIGDDAEALAARVRNAGAIFLGAYTPEAIGDYVGGSNHVLPTARSARFSSGLGVLDFLKRTSILKCDAGSLRALGAGRRDAGRGRGARRARPLRRRSRLDRSEPEHWTRARKSGWSQVTLDENSIGRGSRRPGA